VKNDEQSRAYFVDPRKRYQKAGMFVSITHPDLVILVRISSISSDPSSFELILKVFA
jgi:hypothetical protein